MAMEFPTTQVGQYLWQDNGTGGVDYFKIYDTGTSSIKQPISREEYASGTAASGSPQDPGAIEQWVLQNYQPGSTTEDTTQETTTPTGTGGTGEEFKPTPYMGKIYYTAEDLAQAVTEHITTIYNDSVKMIENQFKQGFITIDERDAQIKKTRTDLIKKKEGDLSSISGYMNSISPDAIQSGRGKLEKQAVEDYTTQNKQLGSELGANLYGADGRIRQDLTAADLAPYQTELSDTGNLARSIAGNYTNKQEAINKAALNQNDQIQANAFDYINNTPTGSNYTNYLSSNILNKGVAPTGTAGPVSVAKVDKYGNPIDEWANQ